MKRFLLLVFGMFLFAGLHSMTAIDCDSRDGLELGYCTTEQIIKTAQDLLVTSQELIERMLQTREHGVLYEDDLTEIDAQLDIVMNCLRLLKDDSQIRTDLYGVWFELLGLKAMTPE